MTGTVTLESIFNLVQQRDLNARLEGGQTSLIWTSSQGYTNIALALIKAGAELDVQNDLGNTALIRAACEGRSAIAQALIEAGAQLDIPNKDGYTASLLAWRRCNTDIYDLLIRAGANDRLQTNDGHTIENMELVHKVRIWPLLSQDSAALHDQIISALEF